MGKTVEKPIEEKRLSRAIGHLKVTNDHLESLKYKKSMKDFFKRVVRANPKELVFYHEVGNFKDHIHIMSLLR